MLLAVTAAPFTNRVLIWVDSPLASAQNGFPVYPRDLALVFLVIGVGFALSHSSRQRVIGVGVALGGIVLVHLQIALLAGWLLGVWALVQAIRGRTPRPIVELAGAGLIGLLISAWWWIPRVAATIESGTLLLGGYPGAPPLRLGLGDAVMAFGVVAIFALVGLAVMAARRPLPGRLALFLVWIVAFLPLVVVDRLVDGSDLVSERRIWLLVSIPLDRGRRGDPEPDRVAGALGDRGPGASWRSSSSRRCPARWRPSGSCGTHGSRGGPAGGCSTPPRGTRSSAT